MFQSDRDPLLLTPGPLTTSLKTKEAMLHDWGSWDTAFNSMTGQLCQQLTSVVSGEATHVCVPLQGSGTFSVEAAIGTLIPASGKVLVPNNGAYCARILKILSYLGKQAVQILFAENIPEDPARIEEALVADPTITHVVQVHCETGTGILNPLPEIADVVARQGRSLIVDAMSSFGAINIDLRTMPITALVAASGKCIEGVPGMGFVIVEKKALEAASGNSHSLAMDLYDQWIYMQKTSQWRFTPPTHVVAALHCALAQFIAEGGQPARLARYMANGQALVGGMKKLGIKLFLDEEVQAPIIYTFHSPDHPAYDFKTFYAGVREKGFILYPGKLTQVETFRVGCIGAVNTHDINKVVNAISETLREMGIIDSTQ